MSLSGVGIHHIGAAGLSTYRLPVPPLDEQRRIVNAIEEHLLPARRGMATSSQFDEPH